MHAQRAKRIAVRHHECGLPGGDVGRDPVLPVRHQSSAYRGQRLRGREIVRRQCGVARIMARMVGVFRPDGRGSEVIGPPPVGIDLSPELPADVAATPPLQRTVMAFVQAPAASYRRGSRTRLGDNDIGGVDRAGQQ